MTTLSEITTWMIEAPGPNYLQVVEIGHQWSFRWTRERSDGILFLTEHQANGVMMAIRALNPDLFGFAVTLGDARVVAI